MLLLSIISFTILLILICVFVLAYVIDPGANIEEKPVFLKHNSAQYMRLGTVNLHYLKKGKGSPVRIEPHAVVCSD